ncbi:hypothetical protein CEXT_342411 [Caerostris extrusa]|uniref:Uncharacterized protein n=1 Tax=Caerostris extrusa TaxID=172846 RepID=A0AAV4WC78_CAEEX|nr:hypothetical protein CEXT_342411 [Caerostris extrusa]
MQGADFASHSVTSDLMIFLNVKRQRKHQYYFWCCSLECIPLAGCILHHHSLGVTGIKSTFFRRRLTIVLHGYSEFILYVNMWLHQSPSQPGLAKQGTEDRGMFISG